jgi:hypothetical protein
MGNSFGFKKLKMKKNFELLFKIEKKNFEKNFNLIIFGFE